MWDKENYVDSFKLKLKEVVIKEQIVVEETKRQIQRDQEEKKREMVYWSSLKPEKTLNKPKLFLMHLGYM